MTQGCDSHAQSAADPLRRVLSSRVSSVRGATLLSRQVTYGSGSASTRLATAIAALAAGMPA